MNSHNAKPEFSFHKTPVTDEAAAEEAEIVSSKLIQDTELSINNEADFGCDPYNTTGQHVILRQKKLPKE